MHKAHVCYAGSLACATRTGAHVKHCAPVTVLRVRCSTVLAAVCVVTVVQVFRARHTVRVCTLAFYWRSETLRVVSGRAHFP